MDYKKSYRVEFSRFAGKQVLRLPKPIQEALVVWKLAVENLGLPEVRKSRAYHDEPLRGQRAGQRSVRLNRAYRVIYVESESGPIVVVGVLEVNKHEY